MFIKFWQEWVVEYGVFLKAFWDYVKAHLRAWFGGFEFGKGLLVERIYRQRGKYAGVFTHAGMVVLGFVGARVPWLWLLLLSLPAVGWWVRCFFLILSSITLAGLNPTTDLHSPVARAPSVPCVPLGRLW
jgi:hypothetical protein